MKSKPQDLADLVGHRFAQIQDKSGALAQLHQHLMPLIDPAARPHCAIANLRGGVVVIGVSSAAWATRLQYQRLELLSELRSKGFPMLTSIEFKVNPQLSRLEQQKPTNSNRLSPQAGEHLQQLAKDIGGELGEKLKRLAAHAGRPENAKRRG
ncbi:DUF721 domain-containing protein [Ferrimonas balearica]|uniref:DUF721 domain-containing protein n=1 Tax=Ferrimonas balearica TaxID=44012 RepID=UPI001C9959DA|nr:DciA family protein [Ferrimonas balearica]MBY5992127.1 DUF721 domain-containing protein [Ferrimonas balearica]